LADNGSILLAIDRKQGSFLVLQRESTFLLGMESASATCVGESKLLLNTDFVLMVGL
jgi:hypothetical protein